jgi:hypothetical protein
MTAAGVKEVSIEQRAGLPEHPYDVVGGNGFVSACPAGALIRVHV